MINNVKAYDRTNYDLFILNCKIGNIESVNKFLKCIPENKVADGLWAAFNFGFVDVNVVKRLLKIDTVVSDVRSKIGDENPKTFYHEFISNCANGDLESVNIALKSKKSLLKIASSGNNLALSVSISAGHAEIVKRLLEIEDVKNKFIKHVKTLPTYG